MSYQESPQKTTVQILALKTLKLYKQHTLPWFFLIRKLHRHIPHILRKILANIQKNIYIFNLVRYALLGITLPSKPPSNHYTTSGLENSKTLVLAYKKCIVVSKISNFLFPTLNKQNSQNLPFFWRHPVARMFINILYYIY